MIRDGYIKLNQVSRFHHFEPTPRLCLEHILGLSSLASNPVAVGAYLKPLILHAVEEIPPSLHSSTAISLLATAGMRLLGPEEQAAILTHTCRYLRSFNFKVDDPSETLGPCGSSVRIITGEEEGLFGWIAVNYLMDGFKNKSSSNGKEQEKETDLLRTTYGFLDMGGASTQIAFEPSAEHENNVKGKGLVDVRLRLLSGEEIRHKVFVTTWLGYGTNQARERYVKKMIQEFEETRATAAILDPCLPKGLKLTESTAQIAGTATKPHTLTGTGSFEQCVRKTAPLLNKDSPCPNLPCPMNGIYVPPIDFSVSHFIGVSEYWYSSEHIFGLGGAYDFVQYERAAVEFCGRHWTGIEKQHEESRKKHQLGGDGEVMKDGKVVGIDLWGPKVETPRLQMQCFKAAWIVNVLHEGLGMPRIVDPEGNDTTGGAQVAEQAQQKGLGRPPTFQSVDIVNDTAISWTLGKMVLEASKEVPPIKQSDKLIVDPVDDIEDYSGVLKPIRPPFFSISMDDIEDKLASHLPSSLTRDSLGFSPVLILIWMVVVFVLFIMIYPLRRQLKMSLLRPMRGKRDFRGESMEEGRFISENGPTAPTWRPPLWVRRLLSRSGVTRDGDVHLLPHLQPFGSLNSLQTLSSENSTEATVVSSTRYTISRGPSPGPGGMIHEGQQFLTSRSRNSSQLNLEEFARRPAPVSRSDSTLFSRKQPMT